MLQNVQPDFNVTDTSSDAYIRNKPAIPTQYDWLCLTAKEDNSTVRLDKTGEPPAIDLEYSTDGATWTTYTWDSTTGMTITLSTNGKVYFRGDNDLIVNGVANVHTFVMSGSFEATGNVASLFSKTCSKTVCNGINSLFRECTALTKADIFHGLRGEMTGLEQCFYGCTGLTSIEIPYFIPKNRYAMAYCFYGCTNLSRIKIGFHSWVEDKFPWLTNVAATGTFICPSDLDCSTRSDYYVPAGWKVERESAPQADWDESTATSPAYIKNKPTIPAAQVQADWDESDSSDVTFILNKPKIEDYTDYLHFSYTGEGGNRNIQLNKIGTPDSISLQYSLDKKMWNEYTWNGNEGLAIDLISNPNVWFRATTTNDHICKDASNGYRFVGIGVYCYATGNIMSLKDQSAETNSVTSYDFYGLFKDFTSLRSMPELPALSLASHCYDSMFYGCTSLSKVSELPAGGVYENCYKSMFENCTSLTKAMDLNAVVIRGGKPYERMFAGCTSLTTVQKELPYMKGHANYNNTYIGMFNGCTSLKVAPNFGKVTENNVHFYAEFKEMFKGCTSLIEAPEFPEGIGYTSSQIAEGSICESMYEGCTSLVKAPDLSMFTGSYGNSFKKMFKNCTSLVSIPSLPAVYWGMYNDESFREMFAGCSKFSYIKVNFEAWWTSNRYYTDNWLNNVSATGVFDCPSTLDTSTRDASHVPAGWIVTHGANEPDSETTSTVEAMTTDVYTVCPSSKETGVLTVASALTLNAMPNASTEIAYAEIVLDVAANATVTAGTNITFVDEPTAGKRNVCVVRWADGAAKLYVILTEDHDESSSSN